MPDAPTALLPDAEGLVGALGIEILEATAEVARGRVTVADRVRQPYGIVHGGVYAALAESIVSNATAFSVLADGNLALGQSNHTTFLRPVSEGTVTAVGRPRHRGRTSWVWEVEHRDADERLCALSLVTIAVRPLPESISVERAQAALAEQADVNRESGS